jgi:hypothetical protein
MATPLRETLADGGGAVDSSHWLGPGTPLQVPNPRISPVIRGYLAHVPERDVAKLQGFFAA